MNVQKKCSKVIFCNATTFYFNGSVSINPNAMATLLMLRQVNIGFKYILVVFIANAKYVVK